MDGEQIPGSATVHCPWVPQIGLTHNERPHGAAAEVEYKLELHSTDNNDPRRNKLSYHLFIEVMSGSGNYRTLILIELLNALGIFADCVSASIRTTALPEGRSRRHFDPNRCPSSTIEGSGRQPCMEQMREQAFRWAHKLDRHAFRLS